MLKQGTLKQLTLKQVKAVELLLEGKTPNDIAGDLGIEVATVRDWQGEISFQCYLNQQSNDLVAAGIKRHIMLLAAASEPEKARGYGIALDKLKNIPPLLVNPEDIQQDIFQKDLIRRSRILG